MKKLLITILPVLLVLVSANIVFADAATIGETGYCAIWGPTSFVTEGEGDFNASINKNWVNATCKWYIEDFEDPEGNADVRTYTGELYNECTIWFGEYPNEIKFPGAGHSTISASGMVTVKCKARFDSCVSAGGTCPD